MIYTQPITLNDVKIIELPRIFDERGNLSYFENDNQIPFKIARAYWVYDVPGGENRGGHAYKKLEEVIVALSGSFDITLHDGFEKRTFSLNRSYTALYVPSMIWRHMNNFSTNSLALIVANEAYNENEYIRDFQEFTMIKNKTSNGFV